MITSSIPSRFPHLNCRKRLLGRPQLQHEGHHECLEGGHPVGNKQVAVGWLVGWLLAGGNKQVAVEGWE